MWCNFEDESFEYPVMVNAEFVCKKVIHFIIGCNPIRDGLNLDIHIDVIDRAQK